VSKSSQTFIALLRGINVGRAKRISMSDLRELLESLGCSDVRTLLNSGNAVFAAPASKVSRLAQNIESALQQRRGFTASTLVISTDELQKIIEHNPLADVATDHSRHLVAFAWDTKALAKAKPLLETDWQPDVLEVGPSAAYLWCASGILESKLLKAFGRATRDTVTTRNWATVLKLQAMVAESVAGPSTNQRKKP
jgi:uncharacterized protein (DUF1697 family)